MATKSKCMSRPSPAFASLRAMSGANALTLSSYKDQLFAYPGILASKDGGAYLVVDYNEDARHQ